MQFERELVRDTHPVCLPSDVVGRCGLPSDLEAAASQVRTPAMTSTFSRTSCCWSASCIAERKGGERNKEMMRPGENQVVIQKTHYLHIRSSDTKGVPFRPCANSR